MPFNTQDDTQAGIKFGIDCIENKGGSRGGDRTETKHTKDASPGVCSLTGVEEIRKRKPWEGACCVRLDPWGAIKGKNGRIKMMIAASFTRKPGC